MYVSCASTHPEFSSPYSTPVIQFENKIHNLARLTHLLPYTIVTILIIMNIPQSYSYQISRLFSNCKSVLPT